jgi:hypothetical protein
MSYIRTEEHKKLMSKKCSGVDNGFYGKKHTEESLKKMSLKSKNNKAFLGRNHTEETKQKLRNLWGGKNELYGTPYYAKVHRWVRKQMTHIHNCYDCGVVEMSNYKLHCANLDGKYTKDIQKWRKLCVPCHRRLDMKGLKKCV